MALVLRSMPGSNKADKLAAPMDELDLTFSAPIVRLLFNEARFVRFIGLAVAEINTRRALLFALSATCAEIWGIRLERRLPFSALLDDDFLAEERMQAFPVEGTRRFGEPMRRSRALGTCKLPSSDAAESSIELSLFMFLSASG